MPQEGVAEKRSRAGFLLVTSVVALFIIDRVGKWLALHILPEEGVFAIPDVVGFVLERNEGISYSIPFDPTLITVVVSLIIVVLAAAAAVAYRKQNFQLVAPLVIVIFGAFSNLLDRLQHGYVVDYIILTSWPVFNIADVMVSVGALWIVLVTLRHGKVVDRRSTT